MKYENLIENFNFIEAEKFLVTIHRGLYFKMKKDGQIENYCFEVESLSGKTNKKYITVAKCKYKPEIGMTNEFEEIKSDYNFL